MSPPILKGSQTAASLRAAISPGSANSLPLGSPGALLRSDPGLLVSIPPRSHVIRVLLLVFLSLCLIPALHADETVVYRAGEDGYHTYRIPALVATSKGTLLAFCEGRKTSKQDHGDVDLVLKRSSDGGNTWTKQQLVHEDGGDEKITIGNPCPVVDATTGTIWLPLTRNNDAVLMLSSTDDGVTWSKPRDITKSVKKKTGPGMRRARATAFS